MKSISELTEKKPALAWILFFVTIGVVFLLGLLASSIIERRSEALFVNTPKTVIRDGEVRNEKWGENYPREFQSYYGTADTTFRSKYGGNATVDMLEEIPEMVVLWAGYLFSRDYKQGRGHFYAIQDINNTLRTGAPMTADAGPQPTTCWTCKSPDVPRMMKEEGITQYFNKKVAEGANYLTFPWDKGMTVEEMEEYYDGVEFSDWTHSLSKAPMLKAQHPDYEVAQHGIHAQRGVACADCHMPYQSEGGVKFTNHKMQSPLNNIAASCQVCHREETQTLVQNVYDRQDKVLEARHELEKTLVRAHVEAKKAWDLGATEPQMKDILKGIRRAQWRWDYVAATHGGSFHAPLECARIVAAGVSIALDTRLKLARLLSSLGFNEEVPYPDLSSKGKAQEFIGLDMKKSHEEKDVFLKEIVPSWKAAAAERESKLN